MKKIEKKIGWRVPGSDCEHTVPDGARVTLTGGHGNVVIGFDHDGSIEYEKTEKLDDETRCFHGEILFPEEFGRDEADRRWAAIRDGYTRATDYVATFLGALSSDEKAEAVTRIVEQLLEDYPGVEEEFRNRLIIGSGR